MQDVTSQGKELIERWRAATKRLESLRLDMAKAANELQSAEEHLAMWLLPDDAKEGEQFCVWYGDSLIAAKELSGDAGYEVTTRKRGKSLLV